MTIEETEQTTNQPKHDNEILENARLVYLKAYNDYLKANANIGQIGDNGRVITYQLVQNLFYVYERSLNSYNTLCQKYGEPVLKAKYKPITSTKFITNPRR